MVRASTLFSISCLSILLVTHAAAQPDMGDAEAGLAVATEICAECHAVSPDDLASPVPFVPSFEEVANTPGITEMALYAWMASSHPNMPNLILDPGDLTDVVDYILSLQEQP